MDNNDDAEFKGFMDIAANNDAGGEKNPGEVVGVSQEDYNALKKDFNELKESSQTAAKDIEAVRETNEKMDRLKSIFLPDDGSMKKKERNSQLAAFDENPIGYMEQRMDEKVSAINQKFETSEINRNAKDVMSEVDQEYVVDWDKDSAAIVAKLNTFSQEYRHTNPKEATIQAMRLAGVGKKRPSPGDFPHIGSSEYKAQQEVAKKSFADDYLGGMREIAKKEKGNGLTGIFG